MTAAIKITTKTTQRREGKKKECLILCIFLNNCFICLFTTHHIMRNNFISGTKHGCSKSEYSKLLQQREIEQCCVQYTNRAGNRHQKSVTIGRDLTWLHMWISEVTCLRHLWLLLLSVCRHLWLVACMMSVSAMLLLSSVCKCVFLMLWFVNIFWGKLHFTAIANTICENLKQKLLAFWKFPKTQG